MALGLARRRGPFAAVFAILTRMLRLSLLSLLGLCPAYVPINTSHDPDKGLQQVRMPTSKNGLYADTAHLCGCMQNQ